jgi:hypothetical protein
VWLLSRFGHFRARLLRLFCDSALYLIRWRLLSTRLNCLFFTSRGLFKFSSFQGSVRLSFTCLCIFIFCLDNTSTLLAGVLTIFGLNMRCRRLLRLLLLLLTTCILRLLLFAVILNLLPSCIFGVYLLSKHLLLELLHLVSQGKLLFLLLFLSFDFLHCCWRWLGLTIFRLLINFASNG